ncbi:bifunctional phosphoribosylaminoimidazolecarboxamide formyltransferase/IMP cyclohydrolase [Anaplasma bovis]|uniref:bifunctional phosphoribosylaminoimidazolecarboxamide formyltransferase/IMP cyclohydrolase n=1 Tax=Anaplasma bovis TaxID=186733 RepID=UPI002FF00C7E
MEAKVALLSLSDKSQAENLAKVLVENSFRILSTKNTCAVLREAGLDPIEVSDYTGFEEIMGGRVKTLHPKIFAGILCNRDKHEKEAKEHGISNIDLVVVDLYPFKQRMSMGDVCEENMVEYIDIGGVSLLRAAAKNFQYVTVISDVKDYDSLIRELKEHNGSTTIEYRRRMAMKAFAVTASYDASIHLWMSSNCAPGILPDEIVIHGSKVQNLRSGENPHQVAAAYSTGAGEEVGLPIVQIHGKELSFNNIVDIESAIKIVEEFDLPAASVIKHANPCGVAVTHTNVDDAYDRAISCDPRSSFGGIIAVNGKISESTARKMSSIFIEAVIARDFDAAALEVLRAKKNLRIIKYKPYKAGTLVFKSSMGRGLLVQEPDTSVLKIQDLKQVTEKGVGEDLLEDLLFAWRVCKHVKSNAIVVARDRRAIGIGAGQMSRIDSVEIAVRKAGNCAGAVMASDAFFPFADSIRQAVSVGISAIVQPGGSMRDEEVIEAANSSGVAMYFTGVRVFCH